MLRITPSVCRLFSAIACLTFSVAAYAQTIATQTPPPVTPSPVPAEIPDEAGVIWAPAATGNYRPVLPTDPPRTIDMVVIHDIEGPAIGAVLWFQNPKSQVSAHYVVDAVKGQVWQQVKERDIGYHAGNRNINGRSIGIEHEGYAYRPGFYTTTLYEASAKLVRDITTRYLIPRDRTHIIGHFEVPNPSDPTKFGGGSGHTDPGPYWDWDYYMTLVRNDATIQEEQVLWELPTHPGDKGNVVFVLTNKGDDVWPNQQKAVKDDALQTRGPVYVGTASGLPSAFYGNGWVSPRISVAPEGGDIAPGANGRFVLPIRAPRCSGPGITTVSETFRLTKVLPAPHAPVPFGPTFTVTCSVQPWEIAWDINTPGFAAPGWKLEKKGEHTTATQKKPQTPATWKGDLPLSGTWDIYARWDGGRGKSSNAVYEVVTPEGVQRLPADQRKKEKGDGWVLLGHCPINDPKGVTVRLTAEDGGTVVADAIRFVGPFAPTIAPPVAAIR